MGTRWQGEPLMELVPQPKYGGGSVPDFTSVSLSFFNSVSFPSQLPRPLHQPPGPSGSP